MSAKAKRTAITGPWAYVLMLIIMEADAYESIESLEFKGESPDVMASGRKIFETTPQTFVFFDDPKNNIVRLWLTRYSQLGMKHVDAKFFVII